MRLSRRRRFSRSVGIVGVDRDIVEEGIDGRAELRHRRHGSLEIFACDGSGSSALDLIDGLGQRLFLGLFQQARIRRLIVAASILLLLDAQDVDGALGAGEEMLAVLGVEEEPKRLDAAHDHEQIVAAEREHGIDQIVPRALVAQMHLQPVGEEGEQALLQSRPSACRNVLPLHQRGAR